MTLRDLDFTHEIARTMAEDLVTQVREPRDEDRADFRVVREIADKEVFSLDEQKLIETLWRKYF